MRPSVRLLLLASPLAVSQAQAAEDPVTFRGSLAWINAVVGTTVLDSAVNPDNAVLRLPERRAVSELRPNLKLTTSALQLIARPRIRYEMSQIEAGEKKETPKGKADDELSEAYGQWTVSDSLTFAYGKQNYQWGAAEALSPSNRMFHETAQNRTVLYEAQGKSIARLNFSLGKTFTTVVMAETKENEDASPFVAEEAFQATGLVKPEVNWSNGADYFGVVLGARERGRGWVGEYFNVEVPFIDGLALYGDAAHQKGSDAWYPEQNAGVTTFAQNLKDESTTYTLAVGGLRYDFEGGTILRAEYVRNDAGWTQDERDLALASVDVAALQEAAAAAPPAAPVLNADGETLYEVNLRRFLTPGLEVPGRRLAYASGHFPDLFGVKDWTFYARGAKSLTDGTVTGYASTEYKVGDAGTLAYAASGSGGRKDGELRGYTAPTHIVSYRHDW